MSTILFTAGLGMVGAALSGGARIHARPRLAVALVLGGFALAILSGATT